MKLLRRIVLVALALLVALGVAQYVASESGEVVVLTTTDAEGSAHETRLWVVDRDGAPWLRAGAEVQAWYARLRAEPVVRVERGGATASYEAVPAPGMRDEINALMLEKYGWADRLIGFLFGRDDSVPIRLDPATAAPTGSG